MHRTDRLIATFDRFLRTVAAPAAAPARKLDLPHEQAAAPLTPEEKRHAAGLMRVNHAGEIAAQALYEGQALFARTPATRAALEKARDEERDHLAWTHARLTELNTAPSTLAPLWYLGAFAIGAAAAALGDKASASFLKATENQVESHLTGHLDALPANDVRSRTIVDAMRADEAAHAKTAETMGGVALPAPAQRVMQLAAKVMTTVAYRV
jgi:3-demethoxyubiquinol 3-hydroxylase